MPAWMKGIVACARAEDCRRGLLAGGTGVECGGESDRGREDTGCGCGVGRWLHGGIAEGGQPVTDGGGRIFFSPFLLANESPGGWKS